MGGHSPLKYMIVDVNSCNFCQKPDVYSVNFILRMGLWMVIVVEVMSKHDRFVSWEVTHHWNFVTLTVNWKKYIFINVCVNHILNIHTELSNRC